MSPWTTAARRSRSRQRCSRTRARRWRRSPASASAAAPAGSPRIATLRGRPLPPRRSCRCSASRALHDDRGPADVPDDQARRPRPSYPAGWRSAICVTSMNSATASSSSGTTNEKIITKFSPVEVRATPAIDSDRETDPDRNADHRRQDRESEVWMTASWRVGLLSTDVTWLPTYHFVEKPCQVALRRALVEREQHRDGDRHDRPHDVQPREPLQQPRPAPRVPARASAPGERPRRRRRSRSVRRRRLCRPCWPSGALPRRIGRC